MSNESSRAVRQARHSQNAWLDTSNVSSRVESRRDKPSGIWAIHVTDRNVRTVADLQAYRQGETKSIVHGGRGER